MLQGSPRKFQEADAPQPAVRFPQWRNLARVIILVCGFLQVWASRFYIEPDGVNYLEIARAYLRHDWAQAVSGFWSPLFSWVLAAVLWATRPGSYWEIPLIHLLNFMVFCITLWCFEFFLQALISKRRQTGNSENEADDTADWIWWVLGYTLFTYASLFLINVRFDTPDIFVNAFVFLASGLVLKFGAADSKWQTAILLGIVLGFAYLAKTVMFPLGFVFLAAAYLSARGRKGALGMAVLAGAVFLAVSLPWIAVLTRAEHRLTFGDSGRIAYWMYSHDVPSTFHWHGEFPADGAPEHPIKKIFSQPTVDSFTDPIGGSYPVLFNPSYWYEGAKPHFSMKGQLLIFGQTMPVYFLLLSAEKELLAGLLALIFFAGPLRKYAADLAKMASAWAPSLAAFVLYALVHVESRFIGGFVAVFWCALFAAIHLRPDPVSRRVANSVILAVCVVLSIAIVRNCEDYLSDSFHPIPNTQWEVGMALNQMGLERGDLVAMIGSPSEANYWAHCAQVRIVADIQTRAVDEFWSAPPETKARVYAAIRGTAAKAIVTNTESKFGPPIGWKKIDATGYSVYFLDNPAASDSDQPKSAP